MLFGVVTGYLRSPAETDGNVRAEEEGVVAIDQTDRGGTANAGIRRFCCKSRLRQAKNRDFVTLTQISARSIHDGPSKE
jgi:hypothetical protein